jgi:ribonuclease J
MTHKFNKGDFLFLPLGGSNEIGMNVNLYHYNGKWIMCDLGAGFAGDTFPGVDMVAPDLSFVYENLKDFLGIVLTHAHEDHVGSVGYLYNQLKLPIYATPFTAAVAKNKLQQAGQDLTAKINIVQPGSRFKLGDFDLELIQLTHSIPEMNAIHIRTPLGNVLHTGDWKFDPNPVVLPTSDFAKLEAIGKEGVLAMVCDSTNVFNDRFTGSEGDLLPHLTKLIKEQTGMVYVTTFASNIARVDTICRAAYAAGRKVAIAGLSLDRITGFAKETGYMRDIDPFISDTKIAELPRHKVLVICTGCQGEERAAMSKIANNEHHYLKITPKDSVIFSSKIIPGNEKKLFKLFNKFVRLKCNVFTEKDHIVHVSGHPSREELTRMYELVKPQVAIPVHGEAVHLREHNLLTKRIGVPKSIEIQNGEVIKLAPGNTESLAHIKFGYLGVDGYTLQPEHGEVMSLRRKMRASGLVFVSVVLDKTARIIGNPVVKTPGLIESTGNEGFISYLEEEVVRLIDSQPRDSGDEEFEKKIRKMIKKIIEKELYKAPAVEVAIIRV